MCRFTLYKGKTKENAILLSNLILKPNHSIIKQSYDCTERVTDFMKNLNGDGFGIGWYDSPIVCDNECPPSQPLLTKNKETKDLISVASNYDIETEEEEVDDDDDGSMETIDKKKIETKKRPLEEEDAANASNIPCVFTSITPAWNNINLSRLSDKIYSSTIFAHVRAATPGLVTSQTNCHPFQYNQYLFMHNGGVAHFDKIKRQLLFSLREKYFVAMGGSTDSELCFYLLLNEMDNLKEMIGKKSRNLNSNEFHSKCLVKADGSIDRVALFTAAFRRTISMICSAIKPFLKPLSENEKTPACDVSMLNFCFSDGDICVISKFAYPEHCTAASLYYASGTSFSDQNNNHDFRMQQQDKRQLCHIISSEPLTKDYHDWIQVPHNTIITINSNANLVLHKFQLNE